MVKRNENQPEEVLAEQVCAAFDDPERGEIAGLVFRRLTQEGLFAGEALHEVYRNLDHHLKATQRSFASSGGVALSAVVQG